MTTNKHLKRHIRLHKYLDELVADFIEHTNKLPSKTTIMELMEWSCKEAIDPTPGKCRSCEGSGKVFANDPPTGFACEDCNGTGEIR